MIKITIPGTPIAKKRPRFARRGNFVTTYNDQQTEEGKALLAIRQQINGHKPFQDAVFVRAKFIFQRPRSHYGTGRNEGILKLSAPKFHIKKPDHDNCEKFIYDILNGEVWRDDSQVVSAIVEKEYCHFLDEPRTEIIIKEYGE